MRGRPRAAAVVLVAASAIALAVAFLYGPTLDYPFAYDDRRTVVENPTIRDPANVRALLLWDRFRPLGNVSLALDFALWGGGPRGFRLTHLLLHGLVALLFFLLVERAVADAAGARPPPLPSFVAGAALAALFAAHPLATQAVVYLSARAELLAAVLVLATVLAGRTAILGGRRSWAALTGVFAVAALAAKETGAVALPLLALYDLVLLARHGEPRRRWGRLYAPVLAFLASAAAARVFAYRFVEGVELPRPFAINLLSQAEVTWRYLRLLVWPSGQSLVQPVARVPSLGDPGAWLAALALLALLAAAVAVRRRQPLVTLGAGWTALALAPAAVVPLNELMAEHRAYLAIGGFLLAVFGLAAPVLATGGRRLGVAAAVLAVGVFVALAATTKARLEVWRDPVVLWRDAAAKAPRTWAPYVFLAQELRARGDLEGAIAAYRRAAEIEPTHPATRLNLGGTLAMAGRLAEARQELETAALLAPGSAPAWINLGRVRALEDDLPGAREAFDRAAVAASGEVGPRFELVAVLWELGEDDRASALCAALERDAAGDPRLALCARKSSEGARR